jgi:hypothetical protein
LKGVVRATTKQEDQEDDDMRIIVFLIERNCEDKMSTRRKAGRQGR